jgi:hypothetical protein
MVVKTTGTAKTTIMARTNTATGATAGMTAIMETREKTGTRVTEEATAGTTIEVIRERKMITATTTIGLTTGKTWTSARGRNLTIPAVHRRMGMVAGAESRAVVLRKEITGSRIRMAMVMVRLAATG